MMELKLDFDEGILLQTDDVWSYDGNKEYNYDEMYLTNKNLIRVYEKSKGLFCPFDLSVTLSSQIKHRYSCSNGPFWPITVTVTLYSHFLRYSYSKWPKWPLGEMSLQL